MSEIFTSILYQKVFNRDYLEIALQSLYFLVMIIIATLAAIAKEAEIYMQLPEASGLRNENIYNRFNNTKTYIMKLLQFNLT